MKVRLSARNTVDICMPAVLLFFTLCEFLYTNKTGSQSVRILALLWAYSLAYNIVRRKTFTRRNQFCLFLSVIILCYTNNSESIRYFLLLTAMIFWSKIEINDVEKLTYFIVVSSMVMSMIQLAKGVGRTSGIFANSPTQMSCLLLVCEYYFLIRMTNIGISRMDLICCLLCIPMLFFTESRSTLAAGGVLFIIYMTAILVRISPISHKRVLFFVITIPLVVIILIYAPRIIDIVMSKMNRTNINASTMTRMTIYNWLLNSISENMITVLFGRGGGFVETYLKTLMGSSTYFPAHQDFLLIICEYGVVGLFTVFTSFLRSHKLLAYFVILYGVCSFHNILLTPTTMIFMVVTLVDLEKHHYRMWL